MKQQLLVILLSMLSVLDAGILGQRTVVEGNVTEHLYDGSIASEIETFIALEDGPFWVAYEVPVSDDDFRACCEWDQVSPCEINSRRGFSMRHRAGDFRPWTEGTQYVRVFYLIDQDIRSIELFSAGCRVASHTRPVHWLSGVDPAESLEFLNGIVHGKRRGATTSSREEAVTAIAMHAGPASILRLETVVQSNLSIDIRDGAVFWLGSLGGRRGFDIVNKLVWNDPSVEIQEKAVFALTQSRESEAAEALIEIARRHQRDETRANALFWIGNSNAPGAADVLRWAVDNDPSEEVRDKAVFGASQLPDDEAVPILIDLAKNHPKREVRKKAIFWLGQKAGSRSVRALRGAVDDSDDDLKQYAVFAIAQLPHDESVPILLDLAENHDSPAVRKKAIFWLSQIDDARAIEAIERILLK